METNFNFKSQICTTREQSLLLLSLGLKKETADMHRATYTDGSVLLVPYPEFEERTIRSLPAWSLHRLIEMMPSSIKVDDEDVYLAMNNYCVTYLFYYEGYEEMSTYIEFNIGMNTYDYLINCIEWLIKEGYFNKEYLV